MDSPSFEDSVLTLELIETIDELLSVLCEKTWVDAQTREVKSNSSYRYAKERFTDRSLIKKTLIAEIRAHIRRVKAENRKKALMKSRHTKNIKKGMR